ncbi:MAG: plastocyanin/azurin family copper-binding protein [Nitrospiraceae bacterium]|nr:plastocyanin/azurin family copper-binding protein [Nitrospiraceae bacterium]
MKRATFQAILVILGTALWAAAAWAATVDVTIADFSFSPTPLTINVGDTVRWTNTGASTHTSTSGANCTANGVWTSPALGTGQTFSRTFITAGAFPYFCAIDSHCSAFGMQATIIVNAAPAPVPITPVIKANNTRGALTIKSTDVLTVTASLNPGSSAGTNADWWVAVQTASGYYHWASGTNPWLWKPALAVTYQGPMITVPETVIFNAFAMVPGTYTFYFALDTVVDGLVTYDHLFFDSVVVTVTP